jgi:hypothetical protein
MPDPDQNTIAVHVPGPPSTDPMPVIRFVNAGEVLMRLSVQEKTKVGSGMLLVDGPASCQVFVINRVEGEYREGPDGWHEVLVWVQPSYTGSHEFRLSSPNPEATK